MMYNYIKVNRKVYQYLRERGLSQRFENEDGSVYLWKFDLASLGGNNEQTIRKIGGVGMSRDEVANEQKGKIKVALPMAEDEMFAVPVEDADKVNENGVTTLPMQEEVAVVTDNEKDESSNDDEATIPSDSGVQVFPNKKE